MYLGGASISTIVNQRNKTFGLLKQNCDLKKIEHDLLIIGGKATQKGSYSTYKDIIRLDLRNLNTTAISSMQKPIGGAVDLTRHCVVNLHGDLFIFGNLISLLFYF